jgi:hypothetical protein
MIIQIIRSDKEEFLKVRISRKNGKIYCEVLENDKILKNFKVIKQAMNYAYSLSDNVEIIDMR